MEDVTTRLSVFMEHQRLTMNAFATKIGIYPSNFAKMMRGQQTITTRTLVKIGDAFPVLNTEWLITGEGNMLRADTIAKEQAYVPPTYPTGARSDDEPPMRRRDEEPDLFRLVKELGRLEARVEYLEREILSLRLRGDSAPISGATQ